MDGFSKTRTGTKSVPIARDWASFFFVELEVGTISQVQNWKLVDSESLRSKRK